MQSLGEGVWCWGRCHGMGLEVVLLEVALGLKLKHRGGDRWLRLSTAPGLYLSPNAISRIIAADKCYWVGQTKEQRWGREGEMGCNSKEGRSLPYHALGLRNQARNGLGLDGPCQTMVGFG